MSETGILVYNYPLLSAQPMPLCKCRMERISNISDLFVQGPANIELQKDHDETEIVFTSCAHKSTKLTDQKHMFFKHQSTSNTNNNGLS